MPSPLAHIAAGCAIYAALLPPGSRPDPRSLAVIAFAAIAPDLDIPLGMVMGDPVGWHHGPTHSLLGAALAGLLHAVLDWSTGDPAEAARFGVPLLWPLLDTKYISSCTLFGAYRINEEGFLLNLFAPEAAAVWARELGFTAAVAALAGVIRRVRAGSA